MELVDLLEVKYWIWHLLMKQKQNLDGSFYPFQLKYRITAEI